MVARRTFRFLLTAAAAWPLVYVLWRPLQRWFILLLSRAAEAVLALLEHPPILTALTSSGNDITIHSYITGQAQPLTVVHFDSVHISMVTCLALAFAVPVRDWRARARVCGLALGTMSLAQTAVCVAQVELAADAYALATLGLTIHTAAEKDFVDAAVRKTSLLAVYVAPALPFLLAYLSVRTGGARAPQPQPARPVRRGTGWLAAPRFRWTAVAAALACGVATLLLIPETHRSERVDLDGLRKIASLNPALASAQYHLALNLERHGHLDEALESYRRALAIDAHDDGAQLGAGNIEFARGDTDAAVGRYEAVLQHDPLNVAARYNLGNALLGGRRFDLAVDAYERVLQADPANAAANVQLAKAYLGEHRPCDALPHLERAASLDARLRQSDDLLEHVARLRLTCPARTP